VELRAVGMYLFRLDRVSRYEKGLSGNQGVVIVIDLSMLRATCPQLRVISLCFLVFRLIVHRGCMDFSYQALRGTLMLLLMIVSELAVASEYEAQIDRAITAKDLWRSGDQR
jgi:hypothetical protein